MSAPLVSVIVPTHNRAAFLPRALDSIIAQTFTDWEIVLVDDGSTDETPRLAEQYARKLGDRMLYIRQENAGAGAARNVGIDACRGRFVAFLDSDDEFQPNKLQRQMELFTLHPELGFVFSDYATIALDGTKARSVFDGEHPTARRMRYESVAPGLCLCENLFDTLIRGYFISTIVGLVRREVLADSIRFDENLIFGEEWLFYLRVAKVCPAGFVDEPLSTYHFQPGSLARSDKQRNAREYRRLLQAILESFRDLTRSQRGAVRHNLAQLGRQIGCVAYREGRYADAALSFADSLRSETNVRTIWHLLQALARGRFSRSATAPADKTISQDAIGVVR